MNTFPLNNSTSNNLTKNLTNTVEMDYNFDIPFPPGFPMSSSAYPKPPKATKILPNSDIPNLSESVCLGTQQTVNGELIQVWAKKNGTSTQV